MLMKAVKTLILERFFVEDMGIGVYCKIKQYTGYPKRNPQVLT